MIRIFAYINHTRLGLRKIKIFRADLKRRYTYDISKSTATKKTKRAVSVTTGPNMTRCSLVVSVLQIVLLSTATVTSRIIQESGNLVENNRIGHERQRLKNHSGRQAEQRAYSGLEMCNNNDVDNQKIFGGKGVTDPAMKDWFVEIRNHAGKFVCGGTLINSRFVLTAAHCFMKAKTTPNHKQCHEYGTAKKYSAALSSNNGQKVAIMKVYIPADYKTILWLHLFSADIAVAVLAELLSVVPAPLCFLNTLSSTRMDQRCIALGVGDTNSQTEGRGTRPDELQEVATYVAPCRAIPGRSQQEYDQYDIACTGPGPRKGDSGGPVICGPLSTGQFYFAGVISKWDLKTAYITNVANAGCRNWLDEVTSIISTENDGCQNKKKLRCNPPLF